MGFVEIFDETMGVVSNQVIIPAILISALVSVIMADFHRNMIKSQYFRQRIHNDFGSFLDVVSDYILALLLALIVVGFMIFIFILSKALIKTSGLL